MLLVTNCRLVILPALVFIGQICSERLFNGHEVTVCDPRVVSCQTQECSLYIQSRGRSSVVEHCVLLRFSNIELVKRSTLLVETSTHSDKTFTRLHVAKSPKHLYTW